MEMMDDTLPKKNVHRNTSSYANSGGSHTLVRKPRLFRADTLSCAEMTSSHPHLLVRRGSYWDQRPYLPLLGLLGPWLLLLQPQEGRHCPHAALGHSITCSLYFKKRTFITYPFPH